MSITNACTECGSRLSDDSPLGLCSRCLMNASVGETVTHRPLVKPTLNATALATIDWDEALRVIRDLDLLSAEELDRLALRSGNDPSRLVRSLVRTNALTLYQAKALLAGKARGLRIGPYLVEDKLGVGGMGVVFKARQRMTGTVIALKILPPSFGRDPDSVRRFRREFQVASRLSHPNIVRAIEANEDRGVHYLTMEYIPGYTLDTLVSRGGPMAIKLALHCAIQVARGLEAAHAQGVVHRDIKPANIMIDSTGAVRVLDLGLARVIEATNQFGRTAAGSLTQTGATMGTVDYLAPEQANDAKSADGRSDIYSLGCTLYFLLVGKPPFSGDTVLKRLMAHQDRPAPSLRAANAEVSQALEDIYLGMMAKRPSDRPQSMSEIVMELEACRASTRDTGDAREDLKSFARTALKRAPVRGKRGRDASIFAQPTAGAGEIAFDPDLDLEDLVSDYREMVPTKPIPEEKLPPIVHRSLLRPQPQRSSPPYKLVGIAMIGCVIVGFAFWPKANDSKSVPTTDEIGMPTVVPEKADKGPVLGAFQLLRDVEGSRPTLLANYRSTTPVADGVIQPDEYEPGVKVDFTSDSRFGTLMAGMGDPNLIKTPDDLSVMLHLAYTQKSLFLAIRVRDQFVDAQEADKGQPFLNDCIELFFDGDRVQNDFLPNAIGRYGSPEGFQIMADAAGHQLTVSRGFTSRDWKAVSKRTGGGYVIEFEVPLKLFDMKDGPQKARASPGSLINFGMAISDNDLETSRHMSYAYLRARKGVGAPFVGLEVAWTMGIGLLDPSMGADASGADFANSAQPKSVAGVDSDAVSVFYKEGIRLSDLDQVLEGVGLLKQAIGLQRRVIAEHPERAADYRDMLAACCNRLSTHYSTFLAPQYRDPGRAVELSYEAVSLLPNDANSWENLGWAKYRVGDWKGCVQAIDKSVSLSNKGTGWDWFFLAMAHKQLGDNDLVQSYYVMGAVWFNELPADTPQFTKARRLRDEAAALLGIVVR